MEELIAVMEKFLRSRYPANEFNAVRSATLDGKDLREKRKGRFELEFSLPSSQGLYGQVFFVKVDDHQSGARRNYLIKRSKEDSPEASIVIPDLEFRILNQLSQRGLPVPDPEFLFGEYIVMGRVAGTTLDAYVKAQGSLDHNLAVHVLESMKQFKDALESMLCPTSAIFSGAELQVLRERDIQVARRMFPNEPVELVRANEYAFRVMAKTGGEIPGFLNTYKPINDALTNRKNAWLLYDHAGNRIVNSSDPEERRVLRFDFNQTARGFYGLDPALTIAELGLDAVGGMPRAEAYLWISVLQEHAKEGMYKQAALEKFKNSPNYQAPDELLGDRVLSEDIQASYIALCHRFAMKIASSQGANDANKCERSTHELRTSIESAQNLRERIERAKGYVDLIPLSESYFAPLTQ